MLLSADHDTPHRHAVLAYDAANEIGLGIVIARPTPPQGPLEPASGPTPGGWGNNPTRRHSELVPN